MIIDNACVRSRMEEGADMHSLLMTDNNSLLMGGLQNYVVEVDLNTVQETQKVRHWDEVCQHLELAGLPSCRVYLTVHC